MQVPPDSLHSYDSTFFSVLNGRKEVFFNENSHLSPDERQERWNQFITNGQLPESINALPQSQPNNVQVEAPAVKRQRLGDGAPSKIETRQPLEGGSFPIGGSVTQTAYDGVFRDDDLPHHKGLDNWLEGSAPRYQNHHQSGQTNSVLLQTRRRSSRSIKVDTFEDPAAYILANNVASPSTISSGQHSRRPSIQTPLSPYATHSSFLSTSPYTESMGHTLDSQTMPTSIGMSRQSSKNSVCRELNNMQLGASSMSRAASNSSHSIQPSSLPAVQPALSNVDSYSAAMPLDGRQITSFAGGAAESKKVNEVLKKQQTPLALINEDDGKMERSISAGSNNSATSRFSRRSQEQTSMGKRPIQAAPPSSTSPALDVSWPLAVSQSMSRESSSSSHMAPVAIPRLPPSRDQRVKLLCRHCTKRPDGYKGEHERRRHEATRHGEVKTVYVNIDISKDGKFLADCDHCKAFKQYNAYYNAGAHLRRRHFNPKPEKKKNGGKLPEHEKRGGKGGGTWPAMEVLKQWMVSFQVNQQGKPLEAEYEKYVSNNTDAANTVDIESEVDDEEFIDSSEIDMGEDGFNTLGGTDGADLTPRTGEPVTDLAATTLPVDSINAPAPYVEQPRLELPVEVLPPDLFDLGSTTLFDSLPYGQELDFDDLYAQ